MSRFLKSATKSDFIPISVFITLVLVSSYRVLPSLGTIFYNDGAFFWLRDNYFVNLVMTWSQNYFGSDQTNITFLYLIKSLLISSLNRFGVSQEAISYILSFGLVLAAALVYYFIFKKISGSKIFGFGAGVFAILCNLSLEHVGFGGFFYYFLGLISFGVLFMCLNNMFMKKNIEITDIIFMSLTSVLLVHPFYFVIYLISLIIIFLFLGIRYGLYKRAKFYIKASTAFLFLLLIHMYWLLPFVIGSVTRDASQTYGGNLDGVFEGFKRASSYLNAQNFFQYFNLYSKNVQSSYLFYPFYILLATLLLISFYYLFKKKKAVFLISLFLYIIFFSLALGPMSVVSGGIWSYLWSNIPAFSFFRSFSRFLIVIIPIYLYVYALAYKLLDYGNKKILLGTIVAAFVFLNIFVSSGDMSGTIVAVTPPQEYSELNKILDSDSSSYSVLSVPNYFYETYKWSGNRKTDFMRQDYYFMDYYLEAPVIYNRASISINNNNKLFSKVFSFSESKADELGYLFDASDIKYVLIHKDYIAGPPNINTQDYLSYMEYFKNNNIEPLMNNENFAVYQLPTSTSRLYHPNLTFQKINPAKYKLHFKGVKDVKDLNFLQSYHSKWNLYLDSYQKPCLAAESSKECSPVNAFYQSGDISYINKEPLFDSTHSKKFNYANSWSIDPNEIKKFAEGEYYQKNSDGSIDFTMTLYFAPQSYQYLGIIISILAVLVVIIMGITLNVVKNSQKP
jgi:hypothetical protein